MQDTTIQPTLTPVQNNVKPARTAAGAALLCVLSMSSVQFGAALSAPTMAAYGSLTTTWLRLCWAALVLAVLVRLVLYPFARRALREQKHFNEIQSILKPQLAEIMARYRGGEQAEHIEELYRAHDLSPAAGMKPLLLVLLQLPILVALFRTRGTINVGEVDSLKG